MVNLIPIVSNVCPNCGGGFDSLPIRHCHKAQADRSFGVFDPCYKDQDDCPGKSSTADDSPMSYPKGSLRQFGSESI